MSGLKHKVIRTAFELFALPGVAAIIRRFSACHGVILTLHRVLPNPPATFSPNAILQITPQFLEQVIITARKRGFEFVDLDEAIRRTLSPTKQRPFVVLTFDDAYRDNVQNALPILEKHNCPFTLFVPTAFVDGAGEIWWQALEDIVAANNSIQVPEADGGTFVTKTLEQKHHAYDTLYWHMRDIPEPDRVALIRNLARKHGYDLMAQCRKLIMDWGELTNLAANPLCTIGAHTVRHYELAKLPKEEAILEMVDSASILEKKLGARPTHLSYPIGAPRAASDREFQLAKEHGFTSGVTTNPGGLYSSHAERLYDLPRISLNGLYQKRRFADVFITGAIFTALGKIAKGM